MGFLKNTIADNGVEVINAYHRISSVNGNQEEISITLTAYPSQKFYLENKYIRPLYTKTYSFAPNVADDADNIFKQAYSYLFGLEEYNNVINILEEGQVPL